MAFKFLTDNDPSFKAVWFWAKQLVTELNKIGVGKESVKAGSVLAFAGDEAPTGWLLCDGKSYSKADQPGLYLAIGYKYGGSGDVFNVPDYSDRLLIGAGALAALGVVAGSSSATLATNNLPSHAHDVSDPKHTHTFTGDPHTHTLTDPGHAHAGGAAAPATTGTTGTTAAQVSAQALTATATTGVTLSSATATGVNAAAATGITIEPTGDGEAFSVLNPVIGINYIIKA
jgi:microcystin-dependent protein